MFKFKGKSTTDMKIIVEEELKILKKASMKYNVTEIPGKNGSTYDESGYEDVEIPLHLQLLDISKLNEVYEWLSGEGILEYSDRVTTARCYVEQEPIRVGSIYTIDITLIRSPFWYKSVDNYITVTNSIKNDGNIYSEPIIRLEKGSTDSVDITVNNVRFKYNFNGDSYVEFDCESCDATMNGLNRNQYIEIGFDVPNLKPGDNTITINSGNCKISFKRKDRYL